MVVDELSNVGAALRTHLRASSVLASAPYLGSNTKIYVGWPFDRNSPLNVPPFLDIIVIMTGRGGPGDIGSGQQAERIDIMCYGVDDIKCKKLWRALDNYLIPRYERRKSSFKLGGCQVNFILREGGPITTTDPDAADWPYTWAAYIVNYNGAPNV